MIERTALIDTAPVGFDLNASSRHPHGAERHHHTSHCHHHHAPDLGRPEIKLETPGVTSHPRQTEMWKRELDWSDTIQAKLREADRTDLAERIADCHTYQLHQLCIRCNRHRVFWNHCDNWYCPVCQPRLAAHRREQVEWWTKLVKQPKHVVLTTRNVLVIDKNYVRWFKRCLTRLRRSKFAKGWRGGCYSLEVTNEGNGWHLHAHLLVDADWIDGGRLAVLWGSIVGQAYGIVKVKDARRSDYLAELTKYVAKGTTLTKMTGQDLAALIDALEGERTFGVFGSLYGQRTRYREYVKAAQAEKLRCDCGCERFKYLDDNEYEVWLLTHSDPDKPRPPPEASRKPADPQSSFNL